MAAVPERWRFTVAAYQRLADVGILTSDVTLLLPPDDDYARGKPGPADLLLVVQVADTSLAYDRQTKLPRYAAAGVRAAWLLDLEADALEVHREPWPDGYALIRRYRRGERVSPEALLDTALAVEDLLLPPAPPTAP
jgi:Uma2 family endonuclease